MFGLNLITGPAVEPVSLAQAKDFAAIDQSFTNDDLLVLGFVSAARVEAERYCQRAFFSQAWRLSLDRFPIFWSRNSIKNTNDEQYPYQYYFDGLTIRLPKPHCISVDSISYVDQSQVTQTLTSDDWYVDLDSEPARIIPATGSYWPTCSVYIPGGVKINFTTGTYGDGITVNTCPQNVVTAISLMAAYLYAHREGSCEIPQAFYRLLDSERFDSFGFSYY